MHEHKESRDSSEVNFEDLKKQIDRVKSKLTQLYDRFQITHTELSSFLEDSRNFSPDIWDEIRNHHDFFEKVFKESLSKHKKIRGPFAHYEHRRNPKKSH